MKIKIFLLMWWMLFIFCFFKKLLDCVILIKEMSCKIGVLNCSFLIILDL